jgi:hypothetical protein
MRKVIVDEVLSLARNGLENEEAIAAATEALGQQCIKEMASSDKFIMAIKQTRKAKAQGCI